MWSTENRDSECQDDRANDNLHPDADSLFVVTTVVPASSLAVAIFFGPVNR